MFGDRCICPSNKAGHRTCNLTAAGLQALHFFPVDKIPDSISTICSGKEISMAIESSYGRGFFNTSDFVLRPLLKLLTMMEVCIKAICKEHQPGYKSACGCQGIYFWCYPTVWDWCLGLYFPTSVKVVFLDIFSKWTRALHRLRERKSVWSKFPPAVLQRWQEGTSLLFLRWQLLMLKLKNKKKDKYLLYLLTCCIWVMAATRFGVHALSWMAQYSTSALSSVSPCEASKVFSSTFW